ncbi:hypothetical protein TWF970_008453 [Orbilia oligospora]|uniref:Mitochondrial division protein 1 n=1 Tax=Orbilia oligospora TaxID=2813651 RepID=A0A7C8VLS3_ORBOL|nr:hypothetical protein TWF970_008453 [Orbilia oligospora]
MDFPNNLAPHAPIKFKANFSFDGEILALMGENSIQVWNLATKQLERNLNYIYRTLVACYDFDRKQLVEATYGELGFWDVETGEKKRIIGQKAGPGNVYDIASSRDGKRVAAALSDGIIQLWDTNARVAGAKAKETNAQSIKASKRGFPDIITVTLSPDGTKLLSKSPSNTVLWDTASEQPIKTFKYSAYMAFSPNSKFVALATYHKARLFDPSGVAHPKTTLNALNTTERMFRRSVQPFGGHGKVYEGDRFLDAMFSPDSQRRAFKTIYGKITVLDTGTGKLVKSFQGFDRNTLVRKYPRIVFSDDGKQLVLGTERKIMVWDIETKQKLRQFEAESGDIQPYKAFQIVALSPDRKLLASASFDYYVKIWDTETGHLLKTVWSEYSSQSLHFSSDNERLKTDRQTIFVSSSPLRIIPKKPASSHILLKDGWVTQHGQNILWLPHSNRGRCSASNDRLLILGHDSGAVSFFEFNYVSTEVEDA